MILKNKSRYKPFYKKIIILRNNPQNKKKVLNFKKNKWVQFIFFYQKQLKWYNKFKPQNLTLYSVSEYSNRHTSYQKRFKNTHQAYKNFNFFYGIIKKNTIKKLITQTKKTKNINTEFLEFFEKRLDVVLYRAKFCHSIKSARQLIKHKKIFVNGKIVTSKTYALKTGDLVGVDLKYNELIQSNRRLSNFWPIPPKHLIINYKTSQIVFGNIKHTNLSHNFLFPLNLEKILVNYNKH
jgi:ribosomal protein S4